MLIIWHDEAEKEVNISLMTAHFGIARLKLEEALCMLQKIKFSKQSILMKNSKL